MGNNYLSEEEDKAISRIAKWVVVGVIALFVIISIFSSTYSIKETETAIITTFGKATVNNEKGL